MSQGGIPYIGCRISLISKSGIRYEGFLYNIDTKESTVALQNVRSFGTEGRRKDGQDIPPSNNLYDYIIFRGADIQDLKVCEAPPSAPTPQPPPHDPAIINMGQQMGHPMYGGYPQMPYPYPPYYNMPYPGGYRGVPQQRQPMGPQGLGPHPQQPQGGPVPAHGSQNRRPNPHPSQRATHPKPEEDEAHEESGESEVSKNEVVEVPETEKSEREEQEKEIDYEEETEKQVVATQEGSEVRDEAPKETNTAGQTGPATGLTGWADAARGAKPKPNHHGNSVQYSHSRANPAGERRSAASARKQPQQHRTGPPRHRAPVPMTEFDFEKLIRCLTKPKLNKNYYGAPLPKRIKLQNKEKPFLLPPPLRPFLQNLTTKQRRSLIAFLVIHSPKRMEVNVPMLNKGD